MTENLDISPKSNGFAVAGLVTGIVSIVLSWVPLVGLVCGILGIVFFSKNKKAIEQERAMASSKGMATGGLVTGIIGLTFSFFYNVFWIMLIFTASAVGLGRM